MTVYMITTRQVWQSQVLNNVYYYEAADVLSAGQEQEAVDAFRAAWIAADVDDAQDNAWVMTGANVRRVDVADLPGSQYTFTAGNLPGLQASGEPTATQVAVVVSLQAPTTKPRRARTYYGGFTSQSITNGSLWGQTLQDAISDLVTDLDTITVTGDTLLRQAVQFGGSPPAVVANNRLQTFVVRSVPGIQRRRRIGEGQ